MVSIGLALTARETENIIPFFSYTILVLNFDESLYKFAFFPWITKESHRYIYQMILSSQLPQNIPSFFFNSWHWWRWN
ncbi:MAG: hypothetical protein ACXAC8_12020 [Candidatus Hodarchaeales archaeon]|jgi:hypothetical protein